MVEEFNIKDYDRVARRIRISPRRSATSTLRFVRAAATTKAGSRLTLWWAGCRRHASSKPVRSHLAHLVGRMAPSGPRQLQSSRRNVLSDRIAPSPSLSTPRFRGATIVSRQMPAKRLDNQDTKPSNDLQVTKQNSCPQATVTINTHQLDIKNSLKY